MYGKQLTNSGPFMESTGKHSLYPSFTFLTALEREGRDDGAILWMKDLGERVFYGG